MIVFNSPSHQQTPVLSSHTLSGSARPPPNFLFQPQQFLPITNLQAKTSQLFQATRPNHASALLPSAISKLAATLPRSAIFDEMARRKRSPNSIRWNHRGLTQSSPEMEMTQCQVCMNQIRSSGDIKPPVEQVDYFVDDDGTLTIKNDICPRTVALSLLCGGPQSQQTFKKRLGDEYNMFVMNLDQILRNHPYECPGELSSQVATANQLIEEQCLREKLFSQSRKREHDFLNNNVKGNPLDTLGDNFLNESDNTKSMKLVHQVESKLPSSQLPDNFLAIPSRESSPPVSKISENNLPLTISDISESIFDCDDNNNNPSSKNEPQSGNELNESDEMISEDNDSSIGMIPVPAGMTVAEAAIANKQMTNTKRGSKILPLAASTEGDVKYQCPICSLELSGDHELTVHIRSHNQSHLQVMPNTCTICGKTLSSQSSLDRHMLVHSGERPFRCQICDMSFTTNGNMHRHSRIHQKNGIAIKPPGRKSNSGESKSLKSSGSRNNINSSCNTQNSQPIPVPPSNLSNSARNTPQFPQHIRDDGPKRKSMGPVSGPRIPEQNVEFLHYMNDLKNLQQMKLLSMTNYMFPYNTPTHSAFPMSPFVHEQMRLQYMQALMNPITGEPLAKRPYFPPFMVPPPREPSPDLRSPIVHRCKECNAEFTNQFALDSHMETHVIVDEKLEEESGAAACKKCKTVAKSAESLLLHTLTHHKLDEDICSPDPKSDSQEELKEEQGEEKEEKEGGGDEKECDKEKEDAVVVETKEDFLVIEKEPSSFINLGFADCTTKKFPLIAKAFCEDNPDLKADKFPVFKCKHCDKEFPVQGAKELHEASHVPEEYTRCPKCNCHFSDSTRLQEHMTKHVSDMIFEESKNTKEEKVESSEPMSQNYFLAQFGLFTSDEHANVPVKDNETNSEVDKLGDMESDQKEASESLMSEDIDSRLNTDNEDDSRSQTSETKILTIPLNVNKIERSRMSDSKNKLNDTSLSLLSLLKSPEALNDISAMQRSTTSPTSSIGSDVSFSKPENSMLVSMAKQRGDEVLPPTFPCKYCNHVLSSPSELKEHQNLHRGLSPYQCKVCPYVCSDKSTLMRHMRAHSGERPYKCKVCDYSFTTKANCERHLRQKHDFDKQDLKDQFIHRQFDVQQLLENSPSSVDKTARRLSCKVCRNNFNQFTELQQHIASTPECRFIFGCKECQMKFFNKTSVIQHMTLKHTNIPSEKITSLITRTENIPVMEENDNLNSSSPPFTHFKSNMLTGMQRTSLENLENSVTTKQQTSAELLKSFLVNRNLNKNIVSSPALNGQIPIKLEPQVPLDFTQRQDVQSRKSPLTSSPIITKAKNPETSTEEQPLDLSLSRSSTASPEPTKVQGPSPTKQRNLEMMHHYPTKHEQNIRIPNSFRPRMPDSIFENLYSRSLTRFEKRDTAHSLPQSLQNQTDLMRNRPQTSSPMMGKSQKATAHLPTRPASFAMNPANVLQKHPAFPQFNPLINSLRLPGDRPAISPWAPNSMKTGSSSATANNSMNASANSRNVTKSSSSPNPSSGLTCNKRERNSTNDFKVSLQATQPSVILTNWKDKKKEKGSSSGSDSSYELAPVRRMLDATDAHNFQEYLTIPETEDEQDSISISEMSEEDSNESMENMFSNSYNFTSGHNMEEAEDRHTFLNSKEMNEKSRIEPSRLIMDDSKMSFTKKTTEEVKMEEKHHDPSNMSEQEIARLIEKVSKENDSCLIKKKRNSYADSPHKFTCPYCPRCFPWMSSLNRHLLTHTGQKPFQCSRCPVTFSTKSNRERHLIRKHNVNMMDPTSRSTMDRPYKCQLCVFSSFSTKSNLIKHYKERHNGATPPLKALERIDGEDGDMDDPNDIGKTCEEEEEEYALAMMHEHEMMQEGYHQDNEYIATTNPFTQRDPHKKRNVLFNLDSPGDNTNKYDANTPPTHSHNNSKNNSARSSPSMPKCSSNLPGIDESVLSDNVRQFLDKSLQQSLEDSQRKAMEEGSTFCITPAMERHLRRIPNSNTNLSLNTNTNSTTGSSFSSISCSYCNKDYSSKQKLLKHMKIHRSEMSYSCHLCDEKFYTRVECLQHYASTHVDEWQEMQTHNEIRNLEVFATRLDKLIMKISKKGKAEFGNRDSLTPEGQKEGGNRLDELDDDEKDGKTEQTKKLNCALCPNSFSSQESFKDHMLCHMATKSQINLKSNSQHTTESITLPQSFNNEENNTRKDEDLHGSNMDMLHNLLGVESSTLDKIFEAKVSAASIFGDKL